jgi:hypothetical protein
VLERGATVLRALVAAALGIAGFVVLRYGLRGALDLSYEASIWAALAVVLVLVFLWVGLGREASARHEMELESAYLRGYREGQERREQSDRRKLADTG